MALPHAQVRALFSGAAVTAPTPTGWRDPSALRAAAKARAKPATEPIHDQQDMNADGVPVRLYRPSDDTDLGLFIFCHGGGWVTGDLAANDQVCRLLANASGHAVLSVDYRLAPEHPFPGPLEDAMAATGWGLAHASGIGCRPDRVAIGGSSAGANLAAVVAHSFGPRLTFQMLVSPVTDCTRSQPSHDENAAGPVLTTEAMGWYIEQYRTNSDVALTDPRISPLYADDTVLAATPPALVITGECDPLRDEGDAYAHRLAQAGVPTSHVRFGGMVHGFFSMGNALDDGRMAVALAGAALSAAFSR